jgi:hypothetical protein
MKPDRELYRSIHRGVHIEVSRHFRKDYITEQQKGIWCFYLFLAVEMFPEFYHADLWQPYRFTDFGTPMQPYAECLESLEWHGGMTYYEKTSAHDYPFHNIKAGCDYDHIWDDNQYYDAEIVLDDAKKCVDSLFLKFPDLKTTEQLWIDHRKKFPGATK